MPFYQILEIQELSTLTGQNTGQLHTEVKTLRGGVLEFSGSSGIGMDGLSLGLEYSKVGAGEDSGWPR